MGTVETTPQANLPVLPDRIRETDEIAVRRGNLTYRGQLPPPARGEVTQAELTDEQNLRVAGDVINLLPAHSTVSLNGQLAAHRLNQDAAVISITRAFTTSRRSYSPGQRWYLAPSQSSELFMVLIADHGPLHLGNVAIAPGNIKVAADLDGDYQITLSGIQTAWLNSQGVNELEIWFGTEAIHELDPWTPKDTEVIGITVSTSEETQIGLTSQDNLPVLAVFRRDGTYVAQIGTILTVGGVDNVALTTAQQIALLSVIPRPAIIPYANSAALATALRNVRISVPNPELLTGNVWIEAWIQGQPGTLHLTDGSSGSRIRWASTLAGFDVRLPQNAADGVASGVISSGDHQVEVRLRFYDAASAGNEIERTGFNIPIVNTG